MRFHAAPVLLFVASGGTLSRRPSSPSGEFYDQVLDPLTEQIANHRVERTKATADGYAVCVEGDERRYSVRADKFV
jgi:hypothetical protein